MTSRAHIQQKADAVKTTIVDVLSSHENAFVVTSSPPGGGKTKVIELAAADLIDKDMRIAVATQTNAQADDLVLRLKRTGTACVRYLSAGGDDHVSAHGIPVVRSARDLPHESVVVVGTATKWGIADVPAPFDAIIVDEAWQMPHAMLVQLGAVAGRFALIGDPGQIPPIVTVDTGRWETAPAAPHRAAPEELLRRSDIKVTSLALPASRRLPHDSVELIRPFYDFPVLAWAEPGERTIRFKSGHARNGKKHKLADALRALEIGSTIALTVKTPTDDPPQETDHEVAALAAEAAVTALQMKAQIHLQDRDAKPFDLTPEHIGITATHRAMNRAIEQALPAELKGRVRIDTPERWQGLERPLMIVVHPLSGVVSPSAFDLDTGRLCVMASRHLAGLIVVGRDHIGDTLERTIPTADQPVGVADLVGRGLDRHTAFWQALASGSGVHSVE